MTIMRLHRRTSQPSRLHPLGNEGCALMDSGSPLSASSHRIFPTLGELRRTFPWFLCLVALPWFFDSSRDLRPGPLRPSSTRPLRRFSSEPLRPSSSEPLRPSYPEPIRMQTNANMDCIIPESLLPLQVFPLLKELSAGWANMEVSPLLKRNAHGTRSLVVDIGLDQGDEFFYAINQGFEVVGVEPNPISFEYLSQKCSSMPNKCAVVSDEVLLKNQTVTSFRKPGMSYLINAGAGAERGELELTLAGPVGTFVQMDEIPLMRNSPKAKVPIIRIDDIIQEDVFLFKIDTQGFEHFVLHGAESLLKNHVVRQVIYEMDPFAMTKLGLRIDQTIAMLQCHGLICFPEMTKNQQCDYLGDSADGFTKHYFRNIIPVEIGVNHCWDDLICLNIGKAYPGNIPPFAKTSNAIIDISTFWPFDWPFSNSNNVGESSG